MAAAAAAALRISLSAALRISRLIIFSLLRRRARRPPPPPQRGTTADDVCHTTDTARAGRAVATIFIFHFVALCLLVPALVRRERRGARQLLEIWPRAFFQCPPPRLRKRGLSMS